MPPGVVTVTSSGPVVPGGASTTMWLSETTVKEAAGVAPNRTATAVARPVPVRVTVVPRPPDPKQEPPRSGPAPKPSYT